MGVTIGKKKIAGDVPKKTPAKAVKQEQEHEAMPSAVHKPKFKALSEEQVLTDELVQLRKTLDDLDVPQMEERYDEVRKKLVAFAQNSDPESPKVFVGSKGEVTFSPCRVETTIVDKAGLIEKLGQEVFNEIAKVSLTDLKKYLSEAEYATLIEKTYGTRTLKGISVYGSAT